MRSKYSLLAVLLLAASFASAQNFTVFSSTNIQDASGNKLAAGQLCLIGTDQNATPINFQAGGGGTVYKYPICQPVTNGAITSFNVANPANTTPAGIYYTITVRDSTSNKEVVHYDGVTWAGATFSLDTYGPTSTSLSPPLGANIAGPLTVSGNLNVTGALTLGAFTMSGTATFNGPVCGLDATTGNASICYNGTDLGAQILSTMNSLSSGGFIQLPAGILNMTSLVTVPNDGNTSFPKQSAYLIQGSGMGRVSRAPEARLRQALAQSST